MTVGAIILILSVPHRILDNFRVFSDPPKSPKMSMNIPNISTYKTKFKNALGALESILLRAPPEGCPPEI